MMSTNEKLFISLILIVFLLGISVIPFADMGYTLIALYLLYSMWLAIAFGLIYAIYIIWKQ